MSITIRGHSVRTRKDRFALGESRAIVGVPAGPAAGAAVRGGGVVVSIEVAAAALAPAPAADAVAGGVDGPET